nr:MAG TPA: hypothetical protein [Caudoviricetes sp.]
MLISVSSAIFSFILFKIHVVRVIISLIITFGILL